MASLAWFSGTWRRLITRVITKSANSTRVSVQEFADDLAFPRKEKT